MKYNAAIYCRLSKEDGFDESHSIQSQKNILTKFIIDNSWDIYDIYVDDGYSGTNFERPGFRRMIKDIESGIVNLVISKDLSRLGRNYIQTGYYTEEYFPEHHVRYIALNDNYDTLKEDNDFAPFKNIINEWYAKDISKKVRFTLDNNAKLGKPRNTVFPLFGYKYNEKYERIPDPETAIIVKFIFEEFIKCCSTTQVAKKLRDMEIKIPMFYNAIKYNYNKSKVLSLKEEELVKWTSRRIRDIIRNEEYLGTYITAKSKSISFKNKRRDRKNEKSYCFKNRYEALIDKNTFELANSLLCSGKTGSIPENINLFKNIIFCYNCKKTLRCQYWYNADGTLKVKYICRNKECLNKGFIYLDKIKDVLISEFNLVKKIIINNEEEILNSIICYHKNKNKNKYNNDFDKYNKRITEINKMIKKLFEQNIKGVLNDSIYNDLVTEYIKEKELLEKVIYDSSIKQEEVNLNSDKIKKFITTYDFKELSSFLIHKMIKSIYIFNDIKNNEHRIYINYIYNKKEFV